MFTESEILIQDGSFNSHTVNIRIQGADYNLLCMLLQVVPREPLLGNPTVLQVR